ncbi:MAG: hypothetical protein AAFV53_35470 [Myxococcota bacterium]
MDQPDPHDIVVDDDRYSGIYSGARFTAWVGLPPEDIGDDDLTCRFFWEDQMAQRSATFGRGQTEAAAILDLLTVNNLRLEDFQQIWWTDCGENPRRVVRVDEPELATHYPRLVARHGDSD